MSEKLLTVCIPFKNEKDELIRTVKSIRDTAGDKVDIIVLNDDSDKNYDYVANLAPYNVEYHESDVRLGSSIGKQTCIDMAKTPYCFVLDSHCRVYNEDWYDIAIEELKKDEDCIYCCCVQYFSNETDHKSPAHMKAWGAYWDYNPKSIMSCGWNVHNLTYKEEGNPPFEVPCILGANYLFSKRWWDYLNGYNGLKLYGREETFISKKSWMAGGKVKCIPRIHTGHKTRPGNKQPYKCMAYEVIHNEMALSYILFDKETFDKLMIMWETIHNANVVYDAKSLLLSHIDELKELKKQFESIKKVEHYVVDKFNAEFQKKIGFDYNKLREQIKGTYSTRSKKFNLPIAIG